MSCEAPPMATQICTTPSLANALVATAAAPAAPTAAAPAAASAAAPAGPLPDPGRLPGEGAASGPHGDDSQRHSAENPGRFTSPKSRGPTHPSGDAAFGIKDMVAMARRINCFMQPPYTQPPSNLRRGPAMSKWVKDCEVADAMLAAVQSEEDSIKWLQHQTNRFKRECGTGAARRQMQKQMDQMAAWVLGKEELPSDAAAFSPPPAGGTPSQHSSAAGPSAASRAASQPPAGGTTCQHSSAAGPSAASSPASQPPASVAAHEHNSLAGPKAAASAAASTAAAAPPISEEAMLEAGLYVDNMRAFASGNWETNRELQTKCTKDEYIASCVQLLAQAVMTEKHQHAGDTAVATPSSAAAVSAAGSAAGTGAGGADCGADTTQPAKAAKKAKAKAKKAAAAAAATATAAAPATASAPASGTAAAPAPATVTAPAPAQATVIAAAATATATAAAPASSTTAGVSGSRAAKGKSRSKDKNEILTPEQCEEEAALRQLLDAAELLGEDISALMA